MRVLVLRALDEARRTAALLRERGHVPLILPTETVAATNVPPPAGPFAGFLATSANAAPWLARWFPGDRRPVLAVGSGTARALAALGFSDVRPGTGRAADLAGPAADLAARAGAPVLYAAGRVRLPALEAALAAGGVRFEVVDAYRVLPRDPQMREVTAAFLDGPADAVLLLSAGQAVSLERLLARFPGFLDPIPRLCCLSKRIAAAVPEVARGAVRVSARPSLAVLLEQLG